MKTTYDAKLKANITLDEFKNIRAINYREEHKLIKKLDEHEGVKSYFLEIARSFNIDPQTLWHIECPVSYFEPQQQGIEYRLSDAKTFFDTTTYAYYQTYLNTPVWEAGITVTVKQDPLRIIAATNTSTYRINAEMPASEEIEYFRELFNMGEKAELKTKESNSQPSKTLDAKASQQLTEILGIAVKGCRDGVDKLALPSLIRGRFFIYRYDSTQRTESHAHILAENHKGYSIHNSDQPCCGIPPSLPLPALDVTIQDGNWYLVAELILRLPYQGKRMNWRILVDLKTHSILYLRALASGVNGLVFSFDPITSTGTSTNTPNQTNAVLNPFRDDVELLNLNPPLGGIQSLQGSLVTLAEIENPAIASPTQPIGTNFDYDVRTNDFAAVNAYYHNDRFFRLVEELGFPLTTYFDGTSFPVEIDYRGLGTTVNAHCVGDGDGIDHACYALADTTNTTNPIGIALDWRVILHELGGHGILYDHVNSPNFGFSHSAGDSFAVILNDYNSEWHNGAALDRYLLAPFVPSVPRRSDRAVSAGWGWGGANDVGSYSSEQILSTTMFRAYRSIGGDSTLFSRREFAARCMAYLMLRAVGTLTPMSNPASPAQFLNALLVADTGDWTSEGIFGGAYGKVLTWSFEKQNLNNGSPPLVDVYIDDGRAGEYEFLPVYWETDAIWNRNVPDGMPGHQNPTVGKNYAYVKIKNRGTSVADDIMVKAFHCKPGAGLLWPADLQPMTTPELAAGTLQPDSSEEKIIGPFEWTPVENAVGHDSMFMVVSAFSDPSNVDNFTAGEQVEDWRLIPNDNNIALKNVKLLPRLVTVIADNGDFGKTCLKSFKDMDLILNNGGFNALKVTNILSSSTEFLVPSLVSYPIIIEAGNAIQIPIRFQPESFGAKHATITITSNDPAEIKTISVTGNAPSGKLRVTGSTCIGGVKAGCIGESSISICNTGDCKLNVTSVAFKRENKHWKIVNNPFPASLHPGSCLSVLIRYKAGEKCPRCAELIIKSDDPITQVKELEMMAYTVWSDGETKNCGDNQDSCCSVQRLDPCCFDEDNEHENSD